MLGCSYRRAMSSVARAHRVRRFCNLPCDVAAQMIGRNSIKSVMTLATVAYTSLSLLLAWLGVILGFGLLLVGILGVIAGQVVWSIAWAAKTAARGRLADLVSEKARPET